MCFSIFFLTSYYYDLFVYIYFLRAQAGKAAKAAKAEVAAKAKAEKLAAAAAEAEEKKRIAAQEAATKVRPPQNIPVLVPLGRVYAAASFLVFCCGFFVLFPLLYIFILFNFNFIFILS